MATLEDFQAHFDDGYSQEIQDFVDKVVLRDSRYIFMEGKGENRKGYCTHCGHEFDMPSIKHKTDYWCTGCGGFYQVRNANISRKYFFDEAFFTFFEKSKLDPSLIVARGIFVSRDFRHDYRSDDIKTRFSTKAYYIFEHGKGGRAIKNVWCDSLYYNSWSTSKKINDIANRSSYLDKINHGISLEALKDAVERTMFQYSAWGMFLEESDRKFLLIDYLHLYAKYPCVEYLTKLGFSRLIEDKLLEHKMYRSINWRGKTIDNVLKLSKQRVKEIVKADIQVTSQFLRICQHLEKEGSTFSLDEVKDLTSWFYTYENFKTQLKEFLTLMSLKKFYWYLSKQKNKDQRLHMGSQRIIVYKDYINECKILGLDLTQEAVLFPSNLYRAHENTMKQVKHKADEVLNIKIAKRLSKLPSYSEGKYLIRPAADSLELIEEGKILHHCVGTYGKRYAEGECDLYVIRRVGQEDIPFVTVEMRGKVLFQARGYKNVDPAPDVKDFLDRFVQKIGKGLANAM